MSRLSLALKERSNWVLRRLMLYTDSEKLEKLKKKERESETKRDFLPFQDLAENIAESMPDVPQKPVLSFIVREKR